MLRVTDLMKFLVLRRTVAPVANCWSRRCNESCIYQNTHTVRWALFGIWMTNRREMGHLDLSSHRNLQIPPLHLRLPLLLFRLLRRGHQVHKALLCPQQQPNTHTHTHTRDKLINALPALTHQSVSLTMLTSSTVTISPVHRKGSLASL